MYPHTKNYWREQRVYIMTPSWLHHALLESNHYIDVTMTTIVSQITSLTVVYSIVYSGVDQRKHQSSASLAFVRGIHRDRKMFPIDDVIMYKHLSRMLTLDHIWDYYSSVRSYLYLCLSAFHKQCKHASHHSWNESSVWRVIDSLWQL